MKRKSSDCCSGCLTFVLWAALVLLLVDSWDGSTWPLRVVELALLVALTVGGLVVRQRRDIGRS